MRKRAKGMAMAFGLLLIFAAVLFQTNGSDWDPPTFQAVKTSHKKSDAWLLDRYGEIIHELRTDTKERRLEWTGLEAVSPALVQTVLVVEDRRFYRHKGVDTLSLISSLLSWPRHRELRGASTLSMQLVGLLDRRFKASQGRRTLLLKWKQIQGARKLEKVWTKKEILEAYLNLVSFRGELVGIAAAARGLFDKDPMGLNETESWILAALPASPNAPTERVIHRAWALSRQGGGHRFRS